MFVFIYKIYKKIVHLLLLRSSMFTLNSQRLFSHFRYKSTDTDTHKHNHRFRLFWDTFYILFSMPNEGKSVFFFRFQKKLFFPLNTFVCCYTLGSVQFRNENFLWRTKMKIKILFTIIKYYFYFYIKIETKHKSLKIFYILFTSLKMKAKQNIFN